VRHALYLLIGLRGEIRNVNKLHRGRGEKQSRAEKQVKSRKKKKGCVCVAQGLNNAATRLWGRWGHPHSTGRGEWGHSGDEHKEQEQEVGRGKNIHT
jgi:hypothetical protein